MRRIQISKRHHQVKERLEPLSLDLRDRDIMRAKQLARPVRYQRACSRRPA